MHNRFRYYEVTFTTTVKAKNQTDAFNLVAGEPNTPGEILGDESFVERISAEEAHSRTSVAV